jgi:outer membrane protein OmpA-like peptidoglycan-associated protein
MKTYTSALFGTAALLVLAADANAARLTSWYGAVEGGANWVQDFEMEQYVTPVGVTTTGTMSQDMGWAAFGSLGYSYTNKWRFEFEGGYRNNQLNALTPGGGVAGVATGTLNQFTLMANGIYDISLGSGMQLSLGGGVGADYARLTSPSLTPAFHGDDVGLAFQAFAGLSVPVASWLDMTMNYRFLYVPSLNLQDPDVVTPSVAHADLKDLKTHTVTLGFRFGGRPSDEVKVVQSAPPPAPEEPSVARHYIIFFGFNKCNITQNADEVLSEAANAAQTLGSVSIQISGHTDTVGTQAANQRLSECRAKAAKKNLVTKGIPANNITAIGYGETRLMVQTEDAIKEPQNRRAAIDLN